MEELKKDVAELKEATVEHRLRLENGVKVFGDFDERIKRLEPKAPDWLKLLMAGVTLLGIALGAYYGVVEKLHDRPTAEQLEKVVDKHVEHGHPAAEKQLQDIREEQVEQRTVIQNIDKRQGEVHQKLDRLLEQQPRRTPR